MRNKQLLSLLGCSLAALPSMVVAQQKVDKRPNILFCRMPMHVRQSVLMVELTQNWRRLLTLTRLDRMVRLWRICFAPILFPVRAVPVC